MATEAQAADPDKPKVPQVSIGMPVYNGEPFIRDALDSLLAQSFTDFELIVSDNASTDGTEAICRDYAARDIRIRYLRQSENRGAKANFEYVRDEAVGHYFMWAAADDIRSSNFLADCVNILDANPRCIAATSLDHFRTHGKIRDFEIRGDLFTRIRQFLNNAWESNAIFYSLMRSSVANQFDFSVFNGLGADWIFILHLLDHGEIHRSASSMTVFSAGGLSNSEQRFSHFRARFYHWLIPFLSVSRFILKQARRLSAVERLKIAFLLLRLNAYSAYAQARFEASRGLKRLVQVRLRT